MRLSVTLEEQGLHPDQIIVIIEARDGPQYLTIHKSSLDNASTIDIGEPVGMEGRYFLVELPAETSSGAWRVWVDRNAVLRNQIRNPDNEELEELRAKAKALGLP